MTRPSRDGLVGNADFVDLGGVSDEERKHEDEKVSGYLNAMVKEAANLVEYQVL